MSKNGIYACKNVVETTVTLLKRRGYDSALSSHFSFQPRTESVKCPARAVNAKSRARHVHVMSLNLLTSRKSHLI